MQVQVVEDYAALSQAAADCIAAVIQQQPAAAVVPATGETPLGAYAELARRAGTGALAADRLRVFQLDAYVGLGPADPRSLYGWMLRAFVDPLGIPRANVVRLPGDAPDLAAACQDYERAVAAAGGFDLAILGLGPNGHLGFNEPPSGPTAPTRLVALSPASLASNARYWGGPERVPRQALTAGMPLLLNARQIVLLVSGAHKHAILRRAVAEPPTPAVPASYLQAATNVLVIADRAAWHGR